MANLIYITLIQSENSHCGSICSQFLHLSVQNTFIDLYQLLVAVLEFQLLFQIAQTSRYTNAKSFCIIKMFLPYKQDDFTPKVFFSWFFKVFDRGHGWWSLELLFIIILHHPNQPKFRQIQENCSNSVSVLKSISIFQNSFSFFKIYSHF